MTFIGSSGVMILSYAFVLSALGAMNGSILTGARVPYAMARDGLFFKQLAQLSSQSRVPVVSILVQGGVASVLALSGTFDQLTDYVVFSSWIFYAMVTSVVFVLRRRKQTNGITPTYTTWGYPIVPALFIGVACLLLVNTIYTNPKGTGIGLVIILSGVPVYGYFRRIKQGI
jgi:APA family basic amino acid/polyamine antiporter